MIYLNDLSFYCMFRLVYLLGCCINHKPSPYLPLVTSGQLCGSYDKIKYQTTSAMAYSGIKFFKSLQISILCLQFKHYRSSTKNKHWQKIRTCFTNI